MSHSHAQVAIVRTFADVVRSAPTTIKHEEIAKPVVKKTLFEYITSAYPCPEDKQLVDYIRTNKDLLNDWRAFAELVSEFEEKHEHDGISVYKSSSWAVCQEFLGNLQTPEELEYTRMRSGIWSITPHIVAVGSESKAVDDIITLRSILKDLVQKYP